MTPPSGVGALLLDLDDTLVTTSDAIEVGRAAANAVLVARRPEFAARADALREAFHTATDETWPDARAGRIPDTTYHEVRMDRAFARLGLRDIALRRDMVAAYLDASYSALHLYPDAEAWLARRDRATPTALVTNGLSTIQRRKILKFRLDRHFPVIFVAGEFGASKPDPSILLAAAAALGAPPAACLMVGDSPERDVAGARAAGMKAAWVNRPKAPLDAAPPTPDLEWPDLSPLAAPR